MAELFDEEGRWKRTIRSWPMAPGIAGERVEFWKAFDLCLDKLPSSLRPAYTLRDLEQVESAEVCRILGISAPNLYTQLHRARTLLRHCLERNGFGRMQE
jgi:RNA polymerase sigma-70 factor (ECF subfamily)